MKNQEANYDENQHQTEQPEGYDSNEEIMDLQDQSDEYGFVNIDKIFGLLQCQLCLGLPRKAMAIKECLHLFCGDCILDWLNLGKKECPVCRAKCPSHDAIAEDHNYDKHVAAFLPYVERLEAQGKSMRKVADSKEKLEPMHGDQH